MTYAAHDLTEKNKPQSNLQTDEIDLAKLFGVLWRGKLWIILCGVLAVIAGAYYVFGIATPVYTTSTKVALESRQEQIIDIESVVSGMSGDQVAINTEVEVLKSRRLIGKLVADLGLTEDPEFNSTLRAESWLSLGRIIGAVKENLLGHESATEILSEQTVTDKVINAVLDNVSVSNIRQSYVFQISAVSEDPQKAARIADRLAELYVEDQIVLKFEKTAQATEWLTDRVAELQIELEASESRLKEAIAKMLEARTGGEGGAGAAVADLVHDAEAAPPEDLDDLDSPLTVSGVVYNEMKGAYSSESQLTYKRLQEALYPDNCYGVDSGGDPEVIPTLTYEAFLEDAVGAGTFTSISPAGTSAMKKPP